MNRLFVAFLTLGVFSAAHAQTPGFLYPPAASAPLAVQQPLQTVSGAASAPVSLYRPSSVPPLQPALPAPSHRPQVSVTKNADGTTTYQTPPVSGSAIEVARPREATPPRSSPPSTTPSTPQAVVGASRTGLPSGITEALDRSSNARTLTVQQGVTEIVRIARVFPNRFRAPFSCVNVYNVEKKAVQTQSEGSEVMIATSLDRPFGIFLSDCDSDRAIPLTIIPEDIPQRDLKLVLDDSWDTPTVYNSQKSQQPLATPYEERLKSLLKDVAAGSIPVGHVMTSPRPDLAPDCRIPGITTRLGQVLEGSTDRVAVYIARNDGTVEVPIQERGCYMPGVLAVGTYPSGSLAPGEATEIYVVIRKDDEARLAGQRRRPALVEDQR